MTVLDLVGLLVVYVTVNDISIIMATCRRPEEATTSILRRFITLCRSNSDLQSRDTQSLNSLRQDPGSNPGPLAPLNHYPTAAPRIL